MTIALVGTGGLFTRLGRIGKLAYLVNQHEAALPAALESLYSQFDGQTPPGLRDFIAGPISQTQGYIANQGAWLPTFQGLAQNAFLRMVQLDTGAAATDLGSALRELIRQMNASADSVKSSTVTVATASLAGMIGTGVVVSSAKRRDGLTQELLIAEVGRLTCQADSYRGGTAAGNESFAYSGQVPNSGDPWAYDWPSGSAGSSVLAAVSPDSGSLALNGGFETFVSVPNVPDSWALAAGVAGTDCSMETGTVYVGAASVKFAGGALNTSLTQAVAVAAESVYAAGIRYRLSGVPAAGVLTIDLFDGTAVINDDAGTPNSIAVTLSGAASGAWLSLAGMFRLPKTLPATVTLRIRLSTPLSAGTNLFLDRALLGAATEAYPGGPWLAVLSGAAPFALYDAWTVTGANSRGGSTYGATFQTLFERLFGMTGLGLQLPSSASNTIADTLITA